MSCKELVELVTDYLEGRLTGADLDRFEAHLGDCPPCGIYLDQMRLSVKLLGRLRESTLAPEVKSALLEAFRDWKARS